MATFSVNQARHLYVVTAKKATVAPSDVAGTIAVKHDNAKNHLYFEYKGADNLMRSDLIDMKNILHVKATDAKSMEHKMKSVSIALDPNINGGLPVSGLDYILRLTFTQYVGMSDEDLYFKYGMVHAYAGMTADKFYKVLALSFAKNLSRELGPLVKIEVHSKATKSQGKFDAQGYMLVDHLTKDNGKSDVTNSYYVGSAVVSDIDSIRITELEQPWRLGVMEQVPVYFTVQDVPVEVAGDEVHWAVLTEGTNGVIGNGKKIADLEYFCMGERGDMYRQIGWPHNITTTYLVDPSKEYYVLDIHYAFVDEGVSVQKSERDITLVCADKAELNKVISDFNTATGLNVASL